MYPNTWFFRTSTFKPRKSFNRPVKSWKGLWNPARLIWATALPTCQGIRAPVKSESSAFCSTTIHKKRCNHCSTIRQILWSAIPPSLSARIPIKRNTSARWGMGKHQTYGCLPWPHPYEADHALSLSDLFFAHLWRLALVRAIWNTSKQFRR